ncbi:MAG: tetratricopeptide repeat protein [Acidobacteriota bacterium]|nr:tetratricopeptide repeat protein [Acidobacteriota bacterium]
MAAVGVALAAVPATARAARAGLAQGESRGGVTPTGLQPALRAFREGRLTDVDRLLARLDPRDPGVILLKARAAVVRGHYADAEGLLAPLAAREPASDAALDLARVQQQRGEREAARATFGALVAALGTQPATARTPQDLARLAEGFRGLGRFEDANATFRAAVRAAPGDPAINTAWGRLFLDRHNPKDAAESFRAALKSDDQWEPATAGLAEALADDDPPAAIALAEAAVRLNPSDVDVRLFLAQQALDRGRTADAVAAITQALAVNPASPHAHALLAGLAYLDGRQADYDAEIRQALAVNPKDGEPYRMVGSLVAAHYRFDDAAALVRQALALDPDDAPAHADLGLDLLRTGDEAGARTALDRAFKLDPYDTVTYNLLSLLDTLGTFTTVRDGDLVIRMSADEAPVLQPYVVPLAHRALRTLAATYGFTPTGPFLIEIFPHHDDFAVRNLGLPGMIGVLGACFGRVVTMDSPHARPPGTFQWEATLWHELAHVVTLQLSKQRVPRWLTEGISVYEEGRADPAWGRNMDAAFAEAMNQRKVLPLKDLDAGFTDPARVSLAYYEASLVVDYLVRQYGQAKLNGLLRTYGEGLDTPAALQRVYGTDLAGLQAGFDTAIAARFDGLRTAMAAPAVGQLRRMPLRTLWNVAGALPGSYPVQMALANLLVREDDPQRAMAIYARAAQLVPMAAGPDSPHAIMATLALKLGDKDRAIRELQALLQYDHDNLDAARLLASLLNDSTDVAARRAVYQRIVALDPFEASAHSELGRIDLAEKDSTRALREFQVALAAGPRDQAAAHCDLAETYYLTGRRDEAKRQTLDALEIAPLYARAQDLLLKLVGEPQ